MNNLEKEWVQNKSLCFFSSTGQWLSFSSPAQESHLNPVDSFVFLHLFAQLYGFFASAWIACQIDTTIINPAETLWTDYVSYCVLKKSQDMSSFFQWGWILLFPLAARISGGTLENEQSKPQLKNVTKDWEAKHILYTVCIISPKCSFLYGRMIPTNCLWTTVTFIISLWWEIFPNLQ